MKLQMGNKRKSSSKMGTVMQHLNFCELDELKEVMRAVREAKINKMRAEKICFH